MNKQFFKDTLGWGFLLWLFGYTLGIILFMIISEPYLGWIIMPIGSAFILWVLFKKIKNNSLKYYFSLAVFWTLTAIVCDYFFLVKLFKSVDYYSFHIYLYYFLTFTFPLFIGFYKNLVKKR
jgi:hypothetical protein